MHYRFIKFYSFQTLATFLIMCIPLASSFGSFLGDFFLSLVALLFLIYIIYSKNYKYTQSVFVYFFLLFWFFITINSFFSHYPIVSLKATLPLVRFLFFSLCVWYLCENSNNFIKKIYYSILVMFIFLIPFGFLEIITGNNILDFNKEILSRVLSGNLNATSERISIFFYDEKILGGHLLRWLIVYVAIFFYIKSNKTDVIIFFFVFFLISILIFFSGERSAIFLYFLFTTISFFLIKTSFFKKMLITFLLIVTFLIVSINTSELKRRYFSHSLQYGLMQNNKFNFFSPQHEAHYKSAFKIFLSYPYAGAGVKMFRYLCKEEKYLVYINSSAPEEGNGCATHPHNTYFQLLAETGIFGFLLIFSFFLTLLFKICKIIFIKKNVGDNKDICYFGNFIYLHFFIFLWPIIPTGSMFHNWTLAGYLFPLGFLIYWVNKTHKNKYPVK